MRNDAGSGRQRVDARAPALIPILTSGPAAQGHGPRRRRLRRAHPAVRQQTPRLAPAVPPLTPPRRRALSPNAELLVDPECRARCAIKDSRASGSHQIHCTVMRGALARSRRGALQTRRRHGCSRSGTRGLCLPRSGLRYAAWAITARADRQVFKV